MNPFDYNDKPTPEMLAKIADLREDFKLLHDKIQAYCGFTRQGALARTALEESAMWANKAICHFHKDAIIP